MSYITYNVNQIVYIKQIGYGTLTECGKFKSISIKSENIIDKRESIIFDPDMFNTDMETLESKKSQAINDKEQNKNVIPNQEPIQPQILDKLQPKKQQLINKQINIVAVKLQNTQILVYTQDINIKKSITLIIKPMLINKLNSIVVDIDINKSLESLKKIVFQKLGEPISSYHNIRFYTTSPILTQLNVWSKTIVQCNIKDGQRLILQAYYAFGFKDINQKNKQFLALSNNSNTITKSIPKPPPIVNEKPIQQPKKVQQTQNNQPKVEQVPKVIALPNISQIVKPIEEIKQVPKIIEVVEVPQKIIDQVVQKPLIANEDIKQVPKIIEIVQIPQKIIDQVVQKPLIVNENIKQVPKIIEVVEIPQKIINQVVQKPLLINENIKQVPKILDVERIIQIPIVHNQIKYLPQNGEVIFQVPNPKELLQQNNLKNAEGLFELLQLEVEKAAQLAKEMIPNNINVNQLNPFLADKAPLPKTDNLNQQLKVVKSIEPLDQKIQQKIMKKIKQIEKVDKILQKQIEVQSKQKLLKKQPSINNILFCPCRVQLYSGRHYWEFKIDKVISDDDIWIGIMNQEKNIILAYLPLCGKKYQNNQFSEYGYICKQNDTIGVLLSFDRYGRSKINFYRNTISCGQLDLEMQSPLTPMVGLGGENQVTIDSKAQYPIESYRHLK